VAGKVCVFLTVLTLLLSMSLGREQEQLEILGSGETVTSTIEVSDAQVGDT
jgi:hypothetical protein